MDNIVNVINQYGCDQGRHTCWRQSPKVLKYHSTPYSYVMFPSLNARSHPFVPALSEQRIPTCFSQSYYSIRQLIQVAPSQITSVLISAHNLSDSLPTELLKAYFYDDNKSDTDKKV